MRPQLLTALGHRVSSVIFSKASVVFAILSVVFLCIDAAHCRGNEKQGVVGFFEAKQIN